MGYASAELRAIESCRHHAEMSARLLRYCWPLARLRYGDNIAR